MLNVGVVGLGAIGQEIVRALDNGLDGLKLAAISVRDPARASAFLEGLAAPVPCLSIDALVETADVIVDCAVAASLESIARPALAAGRTLITLNSGALLARAALFDLAKETGGRILVPSGGIIGFDGLRALANVGFDRVLLISRKPPESLAGAPHVVAQGLDLGALTAPMLVFAGTAAEAAIGFPANANVAATLSMATLGPDRTEMEIWADPAIDCIYQEIHVTSAAASFRIEVRSHKMPGNPRTGTLTPLSAIAALRSLVPGNRIGG